MYFLIGILHAMMTWLEYYHLWKTLNLCIITNHTFREKPCWNPPIVKSHHTCSERSLGGECTSWVFKWVLWMHSGCCGPVCGFFTIHWLFFNQFVKFDQNLFLNINDKKHALGILLKEHSFFVFYKEIFLIFNFTTVLKFKKR